MRHVIALLFCASLGLSAAGQSIFGRNKVVYADRDWQVFESGMIHLYFYPEEEELARQTLAIAVETYAEFSDYFDFEFEDPIPVILYGSHHDFKQTHVSPGLIPDATAGFTEFVKGRVALRATGSYRELRHLVRHELVHAFMLSELAKVMSEHGIYDYMGPPLWFIEGLAESVAREGEPDADAEMFLRDAVLQDGLVRMPDLWQIYGSFLMYKEGEAILDFLRAQYSDDLPARLIDRWWMGRDFEDLLQLELGLSLRELDERWNDYLKRRYFPQMLTRRSPNEQGHRLYDDSYFDTAPVLLDSQDGQLKLACLSARKGTLSLLEVKVGKKGRSDFRMLVEGGRSSRFESLPAFRSLLGVHEGQIAFVAKRGGQDALYVMDGAERRVLHSLSFEGLRQISSPSFSPAGDRLVFSALGLDGFSDLYLVDLADGKLERLTDDLPDDVHPDWHPDGTQIVFVSDRADPFEGELALYLMDLSTREIRSLATPPGDSTEPRWDESGQRLLYVNKENGVRNAYVMELADESSARVTDLTGGLYAPSWLSDDEIVASVYHRQRFGLHRFSTAGATPVPSRSNGVAHDPIPAAADVSAELVEEPSSRDYEVDMGLDIVGAAVALDPDLPYGSGATIGFSDLLGDHQLALQLSTSGDQFDLDELNAGVRYSNLKSRWNKHFGAFRLNTIQRFSDLRPQRLETRTGAFAGLTYPLSVFDRIELTTVGRYLERDASLQLPGQEGSTWLWGLFASYVHDDALWTWDGPSRGKRYNLTAGQSFDLLGRGFDRLTLQFDGRMYREMPWGNLALRLADRRSFGSDAQFFFVGGPSDLRGYPWYQFFGDQVTLANVEWRLPLIHGISLGFPFGPFELPGVRGALFADAARVDGPIFDTGWIGSFGYSFYMTLYPPFVFRWDMARVHDFDELGDWEADFSLTWLY